MVELEEIVRPIETLRAKSNPLSPIRIALEHLTGNALLHPVPGHRNEVPNEEQDAGDLDETPTSEGSKSIVLEPVRQHSHGNDEEQVGHLMRIEAFRGRMRLK